MARRHAVSNAIGWCTPVRTNLEMPGSRRDSQPTPAAWHRRKPGRREEARSTLVALCHSPEGRKGAVKGPPAPTCSRRPSPGHGNDPGRGRGRGRVGARRERQGLRAPRSAHPAPRETRGPTERRPPQHVVANDRRKVAIVPCRPGKRATRDIGCTDRRQSRPGLPTQPTAAGGSLPYGPIIPSPTIGVNPPAVDRFDRSSTGPKHKRGNCFAPSPTVRAGMAGEKSALAASRRGVARVSAALGLLTSSLGKGACAAREVSQIRRGVPAWPGNASGDNGNDRCPLPRPLKSRGRSPDASQVQSVGQARLW
jgi:hypothetical protein